MTGRASALLAALVASLISALSLGNLLYYWVAYVSAFLLLYGLVSTLWTRATLSYTQRVSAQSVPRGERADLLLSVEHKCLLPIASLHAHYAYMGEDGMCLAGTRPYTKHQRRIPLSTRHVGSFGAQMDYLLVTDLFGLFRLKCKVHEAGAQLLVLPRPFDIDKPRFTVGDDGSIALGRTTEDYTSPDGVRNYRSGDAMKRIHWKLSSRRRELVVRTFEMPAPPDTLIILDCSAPQGMTDKPESELSLRDALCETSVAIAQLQMADGSPVRLPLYGQNANEFMSDHAGNLKLLQEMLAMQTFRGGEEFSRVLNMELRRMRRTGATIIVTTRLSAEIVDAVSRIRRMGPSARLYLVTYSPEEPALAPYVSRLQHHLVEVCYVTPAN